LGRSVPPRCQRPTDQRGQHKSALIHEDERGSSTPGTFFLSEGTPDSSSGRFLPRCAREPGSGVVGNSSAFGL
jgi:hypothetical protein